MNDLISRQAAIDAVMRNACNTQRIYEAIKGLPSEQPEMHDKRTETHTCDLINRQAAIDALHMHLMYRIGTDNNKKRLDDWINSLPSAHPEIIRCRECRHWYTGDGYNHENGAQCELTHMWMGPDDYCSYGRRKVSE